MKKLFYAAAVSVAVCTLVAAPARSQTGNPRVGPFAEERTGAEAPSAKGAEKKASPSSAAPRPEKKEGAAGASSKQVNAPAAVSTAATNLAPSEQGAPNATSDAPQKKASDAAVLPVGVNVKAAPHETAGRPDADARPNDATTNDATDPARSAATESNRSATNETAKGAPAPAAENGVDASARAASAVMPPAAPLTSVYRVGVGDVLDIRLLNDADPRQSTLYSVMAGGVLEYPLVRDPMTVAGMTTEEVAAQLIAELRHRSVFEHPQVRVSVRDYASHTVLVSGLVSDPGPKTLQREAVPLYVVVAWAQPKPEAGRAVVVSHATGRSSSVDLNDATAMGMLVQQSDVITLIARPPEFFYIGGEINSPGQKDFHTGLTLTQAVLASGGVARPDSLRVRVSRQGPDGRLVSTEYNLREIEEGKVPDPPLQAGDRVEVGRVGRK